MTASSPLKVNLGCGRDIRPGWVNLDRWDHPGVTLGTAEHMPFEDASVDYLYASHVLEHVLDFGVVWHEIHRVLRVGGTLHIEVPDGVNYNPGHIRYFDLSSARLLVSDTRSLDSGQRPWYELVEAKRLWSHDGFPRWHLWKRYRVELPWPFRKRNSLRFILRKVE